MAKPKSSSCGPTTKARANAIRKTEKTDEKEFLQTYNSSQFAGSFIKNEP